MKLRAPDSSPALLSLRGQKTPEVASPIETIPIARLLVCIEDWLYDAEYNQQTERTLEEKRGHLKRFLWYLEDNKIEDVGLRELRGFLSYLTRGHNEPRGRWGNAQCRKPLRPVTIKNYYIYLHGLFEYLTSERHFLVTPFERISPPLVRLDQPEVFTEEQVIALQAAAKKSFHPSRDYAIIMLMLDTGLRASEVCGIKVEHLDLDGRRVRVLGKGNKERTVYLGRKASRAIYDYLKDSRRQAKQPLFCSDKGITTGDPLTRSGIMKLYTRLGAAAPASFTKCSPHMMRRFFAVQFLRNGGNVFTLKEMLGHTTLTMTNRYVVLAQADLENQHRHFSPGDRLGSK